MIIKENQTKFITIENILKKPIISLLRNGRGYEICYSDTTATDDDLREQRCEARICASFSASLH